MIRNEKQILAGRILAMYNPIFARHSNLKKGAVFHLNSLGVINLHEKNADDQYIRRCCDLLYAYREMQLLSANPTKIKECLNNPDVLKDLQSWLNNYCRLKTREGVLKKKVQVYLYGDPADYDLCEGIKYAVAI